MSPGEESGWRCVTPGPRCLPFSFGPCIFFFFSPLWLDAFIIHEDCSYCKAWGSGGRVDSSGLLPSTFPLFYASKQRFDVGAEASPCNPGERAIFRAWLPCIKWKKAPHQPWTLCPGLTAFCMLRVEFKLLNQVFCYSQLNMILTYEPTWYLTSSRSGRREKHGVMVTWVNSPEAASVC